MRAGNGLPANKGAKRRQTAPSARAQRIVSFCSLLACAKKRPGTRPGEGWAPFFFASSLFFDLAGHQKLFDLLHVTAALAHDLLGHLTRLGFAQSALRRLRRKCGVGCKLAVLQ